MKLRSLMLAMTAIAVAACESDDSTAPVIQPDVQTLDVQVIHASPDAPAVNITLGPATVASGVDFKDSAGPLEVTAGSTTVAVDGILADGSTATVIGPVDLPLAPETITTIVAVNDVANIEPVVLEQPRTPVTTGSARVFVLHGAAAAPTVDVYVTAPGADLAASAPLGTFSFRETLGPVEVTGDTDYQIRVTAAGDPTAVVYDSGTVTLPAGLDAVLVATPNVEGGSAAITLLGQTPAGAVEFRDTNAPARLRVVHASPDAPAVDVIADGAALISDLSFPDDTGIVEVPPATYQVEVAAAGQYPNAVVIPNDGSTVPLTLEAGTTTNVLAIGELANIQPLVADDDARSIGIYGKVRIIHASPTAGDVDIYVAAPGTDISTISPTLTAVPFAANTGFIPLDNIADTGADYEVTVTPTGSTTPAIGPLDLAFDNGDVLTVIARDAVGGGAPLDVIVLAD